MERPLDWYSIDQGFGTSVLTQLVMGLVGLTVGALVALVSRSLPATGQIIARPCCFRCGAGLSWVAFSAFARLIGLGRSCASCGSGQARGDLWLEAATAIVFILLAGRWIGGPSLAIHLAFATLLMIVLAIDLRHREVYLVLCHGGVAIAIAAAPIAMSGAFSSAAVGTIVGSLVFGAFYLAGRMIYRGDEPLGLGDVSIAALLGAMAGFPAVITALVIGIITGGIMATIVLITSRSRKTIIPYGPALCFGGLVTLWLG